MKIGDKVQTPHGPGKIVDEDKTAYSNGRAAMQDGQRRWGVMVEKPKVAYNPAYFVDSELLPA